MEADDDRFRAMFYEEARELLIGLEEGLMELERRQGDRAHLDKTFRAAHSIKGAAAMVGLRSLAEFTHHLEAVLDRIRSGTLAIDSDIITTLLEARDHLAAMVESEAAKSPIPASSDLVERMSALLRDPSQPRAGGTPSPAPPVADASGSDASRQPRAGGTPSPAPPVADASGSDASRQPRAGGTPSPAPAPAAPPLPAPTVASAPAAPPPVVPDSVQPAAIPKPKARGRKGADGAGTPAKRRAARKKTEKPDTARTPGITTYRITLKPGADVLRRGVNPLGVLDELRELGETRVATDPELVPALNELDPERCYLTWWIELDTTAPAERLDDVFLFVAEDSAVTIERLSADGTPEPLPPPQSLSTPVPPVAAAPAVPFPEEPPLAPLPSRPEPVPAGAGAPPPPARPPAPLPGGAGPRPPSRIRVDAGQLDDLVGLAGELAVLSDNLQTIRDLHGAGPWVHTLEALERVSRQIRDTTLDLRMVPVDELFSRFPRVVRDLADRSGKEIELRIMGQETRLDRTIVERLSDPMIHLIRNAVDHALETPQERLAAGKPRAGRITLSAGHEGDRVTIRVGDDGRGLDRERIVAKGVRLGLVPMGTSADDPRVDTLIFEPGFSTRDQATELSGRGVGLDVVRDAVRGLRGSLSVDSTPGKGTTFIFRLPLTLALIDGLLVETAGSRYVVPLAQVEECVALNGTKPALSRGRPCVAVRGELVPMVPLRRLFHNNGEPPARQELLLTSHAGQRVGVAVDRLLGRVQAVIQSLGEGLHGINRFSGATILGDGSVSLILDLAALVSESRAADTHTTPPGVRPEGF